jgi:hypothetical protein
LSAAVFEALRLFLTISFKWSILAKWDIFVFIMYSSYAVFSLFCCCMRKINLTKIYYYYYYYYYYYAHELLPTLRDLWQWLSCSSGRRSRSATSLTHVYNVKSNSRRECLTQWKPLRELAARYSGIAILRPTYWCSCILIPCLTVLKSPQLILLFAL